MDRIKAYLSKLLTWFHTRSPRMKTCLIRLRQKHSGFALKTADAHAVLHERCSICRRTSAGLANSLCECVIHDLEVSRSQPPSVAVGISVPDPMRTKIH